ASDWTLPRSRRRCPAMASLSTASLSIGALHQAVRGQARINHFLCALGSGYRESRRVNQTELREHRRLIPVDVLVREFVAAKIHDHDEWNSDALARRRDAWQHPVHFDRVGEFKDHLVHHAIRADSA